MTNNKPPDFIYLQWYGEDCHEFDEPEPAEEVTWCEDEIWNTDVFYVRWEALTKRMQNELLGNYEDGTVPTAPAAPDRLRTRVPLRPRRA